MRSIRITALAAALALAGVSAGCQKPNLEATGGGYAKTATSAAEADTGLIAPHEGPAPTETGSPPGEGAPPE